MDQASQAFLYLAVLVSIIFGLAIQQILLGYRDMILSRGGARWSYPVLVWSVIVLLIISQNWWESFGLVGRQSWTFLAFAMILVQAVIIFLLAAVIFPRSASDETIDLKRHYLDRRVAIYAIAAAYVISCPLRAFVVDRAILPPIDWIYHGAFLALFLLLASVRHALTHRVGVSVVLALFVAYIATMTPVLASG